MSSRPAIDFALTDAENAPPSNRKAFSVTAAPLPPLDPAYFDAAQTAKAWPFEEARKIVARLKKTGKKEALFETGYGPSGLPHIGTFGEVARTTMVRTAFRLLTRDEVPTRLLCFSDDMDGMRKIPDNVPCLLYTSPSPRDGLLSRMPSSA